MKLKEFLKKYSPISNKFINEFYKIITRRTKTEFIVDVDTMKDWLGMRKGAIKDTLKESYTKDTDYKILKAPQKSGKGGHNKEIILLTVDCFKRYCMMSKTKKADEVRTYFIELENLIDKYKDYIINGLRKENEELAENQKPKYNKRGGVIYIIKSKKELREIYKIGKTVDFKSRFLSHNSSQADDLEVVFVYETGDIDKVEGCLKALLKDKQYRSKKEIYEVDKDVIKNFIIGCDELVVSKGKNKSQQKGGTYYIKLSREEFDNSDDSDVVDI
jgi:phage anti-repressor protein